MRKFSWFSDSFTDTGISKFNGELKEKEMKELQPWDSEGGDEISLDGTGDKSSVCSI